MRKRCSVNCDAAGASVRAGAWLVATPVRGPAQATHSLGVKLQYMPHCSVNARSIVRCGDAEGMLRPRDEAMLPIQFIDGTRRYSFIGLRLLHVRACHARCRCRQWLASFILLRDRPPSRRAIRACAAAVAGRHGAPMTRSRSNRQQATHLLAMRCNVSDSATVCLDVRLDAAPYSGVSFNPASPAGSGNRPGALRRCLAPA